MRAVDFKFDGQWLSDAGYIVCTFGTGGTNNVSVGSNIEFQTVSQHGGQHFALTNSEYSECYTATFNICKDDSRMDDVYISEYDVRYIMRWLNRKTFHEFIPVGDSGTDRINLVYYGSFNVTVVEYAGRVIGFELTLTTNSPFAFGSLVEETYTVDDAGGSFYLENLSDEIGATYPEEFIVTCRDSGNLSVTNVNENRTTYIGNCSSNEVITMDCRHQIVSTSDSNHKIYNDFNFSFPRLYSSFDVTRNEFTCSLPCSVTIKYRPVRKAAL